ncbi:MAG TPA: hypothetical protein ENJ28_01210 [Gammaproteobacteria bacterium]|nr:hypothetical protein [Gammaproteobacteria bacterium]
MKKALLSLVLFAGMTAAHANPLILVGHAIQVGVIAGFGQVSGMGADSKDLFKTVTVSHAGENGYVFDITKYEYNQNPSKFDLK